MVMAALFSRNTSLFFAVIWSIHVIWCHLYIWFSMDWFFREHLHESESLIVFSLTVICKYLSLYMFNGFFVEHHGWWRFPQHPLIKMSLPQAIVPWRSTVIQEGCVALRWLQRIDACHAMITFPVRGTLGMCCLFFWGFVGFFLGSMDFLGGFE